MPVAGALVLVTAVSLLLRTGGLHDGFWIDEGIAVGIASHDVTDIPVLLRQDGSPPLYYLLLHGWMELFGTGEAAARALSLLFAAITVPVSYAAATAVADRRAGAIAAALAAGCPLLSYYGQEARMYTLVALLSVVVACAFVLGVVRGRRPHLVVLTAALVLLLYTHTWGLFLAAALAVVWIALWRAGRVAGRDGVLVGAAVVVLYSPWMPSLAFQALHTGAPWSVAPSALLLAAAGIPALLAWRARTEAVRLLALITAVGVTLAWLGSQLEPAWSGRYLAVLYGPLALALAGATARRAPVVVVAALALLTLPLPAKSNVRAVAVSAGINLRPGDIVISTQPEQVPVLERYLPAGVEYLTPLGRPRDPTIMDWRDALRRIRTGAPRLPPLRAGQRIVLVTPILQPLSPWARAIRDRTREWRSALRADPRLHRLGATSRPDPRRFRSTVRAEIYVVQASARRGERSWRNKRGAAEQLDRPSFVPSVDPRMWCLDAGAAPAGRRSTLSSRRSSTVTTAERSDHPPDVVTAMDRFLDTCSTSKLGRRP